MKYMYDHFQLVVPLLFVVCFNKINPVAAPPPHAGGPGGKTGGKTGGQTGGGGPNFACPPADNPNPPLYADRAACEANVSWHF